jgi:hypothetical protein
VDHLRSNLDRWRLPTGQTQLCVLEAGPSLLDDEVRAAHELAERALAIRVDNHNALPGIDGLEAVAITDHRLCRPGLAPGWWVPPRPSSTARLQVAACPARRRGPGDPQ